MDDISTNKHELLESSSAVVVSVGTKRIACKASQLSEQLNALSSDCDIEFCTAGEFSFHHLIEALLEITGPADLYLSTWTIKEDPARVLASLKQKGVIKSLYCVFDHRVRTLDAKHFHFVEKVATSISLTQCHAKAAVLLGEKMNVVITTSANMSNNPRIEIGRISALSGSVLFHLDWMSKIMNGKKVYGK